MSTRWAALAAVIIILASSLCIPMAANGSDGDVATGSQSNPLSSLSTTAALAADKTFYVATGGSVTIDMTGTNGVGVSGGGLSYQSAQSRVTGNLTGNATINFNNSDMDPWTITIVSVAAGGSVSTGSASSPLRDLTASFADAKGKTFYVAVGGLVDLFGSIADWQTPTFTTGHGLGITYAGDTEHLGGRITTAGTITINVAEGPSDNVRTITIVAVGSGSPGSGAYTYTVRYYNEGSLIGTQTGNGPQSHGYININQNDPDRSGWTFLGWAWTSAGTYKGYHQGDAVYVTSLSTNDLYASWGRVVNFNPNGGDGGITAMIYRGTALDLPATTRDGYTFDGWYTSSTNGSRVGGAGDPYTPTGNMMLFAHWTQSQSGTTSYTVTFDANGGNVGSATQTVQAGNSLTLYTATKTGSTFQGWYTAPTNGSRVGGAGDSYTPTGNITLYAHWTQGQTGVSYTVTFDANGGATAGGTTTMTYTGAALTLPDATKTGHTFQGWYTALTNGSRVGGAGDSYTPTGNVTLHALWIQNQSGNCTVTFVTHPPGEGTFAVGTAGSGGMPTTNIVTVPRGTTLDNGVGPSGWSFMNQINFSDGHYVICTYDSSQTTLYGWLVDGEALKERTVTVQDDMTVTAMFTALGEAAIAIQESVTAERGTQNNVVRLYVYPNDSINGYATLNALPPTGTTGWTVSIDSNALTFSVPANAAVGDYTIDLTATCAGYVRCQTSITVHVTAPATPEVTITAPGIVSAEKGSQNNTFNISTVPSDAILTITMPSGWGPGTVNNGKLTFSVPANATPGNTYKIQLTATATGYLNKSAEVTVRVTEPAALVPVGINVSNSVSAVKGSTGNTIGFTTTPSDATVTATGDNGWSFSVSGGTVTYSVPAGAASGDHYITLTASKTGYETYQTTVTVHVADVLRFENTPYADCSITGASS